MESRPMTLNERVSIAFPRITELRPCECEITLTRYRRLRTHLSLYRALSRRKRARASA